MTASTPFECANAVQPDKEGTVSDWKRDNEAIGIKKMSYRSLWIIAFSIEAILMAIGLLLIDSYGSLSWAIAWIATQMPSYAISNFVIAEHFDSDAPFFILTFILQGALLSSVFSLFKWMGRSLTRMSRPTDSTGSPQAGSTD